MFNFVIFQITNFNFWITMVFLVTNIHRRINLRWNKANPNTIRSNRAIFLNTVLFRTPPSYIAKHLKENSRESFRTPPSLVLQLPQITPSQFSRKNQLHHSNDEPTRRAQPARKGPEKRERKKAAAAGRSIARLSETDMAWREVKVAGCYAPSSEGRTPPPSRYTSLALLARPERK